MFLSLKKYITKGALYGQITYFIQTLQQCDNTIMFHCTSYMAMTQITLSIKGNLSVAQEP